MRGSKFHERYAAARHDIYAFCELMRFQPTWQQRQLLDLVQEGHLRIAVKSGQGPGKTTCSGVIALWNGLRYKGTKGIVTAPTMRQCREVWMAEVRRLLTRAHPRLRRIISTSSTKVTFHGQKDWNIEVVTATNPESAQGYHQERLFVICEEASGIPAELITQYKGTLSNHNGLLLQIGNPNTRDCDFFKCFTSNKDKWKTLTFNAEETPASSWFNPQRNKELEEEFGRNSDVYRVRVLGEFPHVDPNCVMSQDEVEACMDESLLLPCARASTLKQIGVDFARFGGDENVAYRRAGNAIVQGNFWPRTDPNKVVAHIFKWQEDAMWRDDATLYVADAGGIGQGVMHNFYSAGKRLMEFHFGGSASQPRKYANKITEAWFTLARRIRRKEVYLPKDPVLLDQLSNRQYSIDNRGRLILEKKSDYVKRGHSSPDRADAVCMAFYDSGVQREGSVISGYSSAKVGRAHRRG